MARPDARAQSLNFIPNRMRIWYTCIGQRLDGADDTRTMLLCAEMLRRGHDVTLWTSAYDHIRKEWRGEWRASGGKAYRQPNGLTVEFMKGCGYTTNVSVRRFADHWLAARDFLHNAKTRPRPDLIVASLPDHFTADAAVDYGRRAGVPAIVDVRDKWPDVFVDHARNGILGNLARAALFTENRRAARALSGATAVVANMQSMMDWGLKKTRRAPTWRERVFYLTSFVRNFDTPPVTLPPGPLADAIEATRGRTVFTFVGTFNRTQHPSLILDALDRLQASGRLDPERTAVLIAGRGLDDEKIRHRCAAYANVHYVGWVDAQQMRGLLAASHVGLLVMNVSSPAFNNKAFAYLASGLPIINGATGDLFDILEERSAGVNVPGGDAAALADAIHRLAVDPELRARLTANARDVFLERFDRDANYRAFGDHIERIAENYQ
jgi:glycosyltransferase involved in cell wall biosynthesis